MEKSIDHNKFNDLEDKFQDNIRDKKSLDVFSGCCKSQSLSGEIPEDCCKNKNKK
ncbi:MAG: hypothetical protein ABIJ45_12880 [Candidatus Zixiibacteriota bacterium]